MFHLLHFCYVTLVGCDKKMQWIGICSITMIKFAVIRWHTASILPFKQNAIRLNPDFRTVLLLDNI